MAKDILNPGIGIPEYSDPVAPSFDENFISYTNRDYTMADYQYELLMESIKEFETGLDDRHEVALYLTSFGKSVLLHVTKIGYANPCMLYFHGYVNNVKSTLIQHVSQLSFLLTSVEKADATKPPRRICGFASPKED